MNDKIEFRVWDKLKKEFIKDGFYYKNEYISIALGFYSEVCVSPKNLILQQFTGCFDNNGRKIYNGDIVYLNQYRCPEVDKQNLFQIVFQRGAFQLKPIKLTSPPNGGCLGFTWLQYIEGFDKDGSEKYRYELPPPQPMCNFGIIIVIGNILENPELL